LDPLHSCQKGRKKNRSKNSKKSLRKLKFRYTRGIRHHLRL